MKFLLLDDHPLFRQALKSITQRLDPAATVLECASYEEAQPLLGDDDVDLVLLDLRLCGLDGMEVLATLRAQHPTLPVVVVSASEDPHEVMAVLRLGALGFVPKASSADVMEHALRLVLSGDTYLPSHILLDPQTPAALPKDSTLDLTQLGRLQVYLLVYCAAALFLSLWLLPGLVAALTPVSAREVLASLRP